MKAVTDSIFLGFKIAADGDRNHEIKRHFLLVSKAMTNLDSMLKNKDITLPKISYSQTYILPVVTYA